MTLVSGVARRCDGGITTLWWILAAGLGMNLIALVGVTTLVVGPRGLDRLMNPLVGLAAGSLLGGAVFHLLPEGIRALDDLATVGISTMAGILAMAGLERYLHWHHCHRATHDPRRPLGWMVLVADGIHNLIGGLAVGGAFVVDVHVGIVAWCVAAAHEIPQELGDFGVLVHSGWSRRSALVWNLVSALGFGGGALIAYLLRRDVEVAVLVPFAAGNFAYLGVVDLLPEATTAAPPGTKRWAWVAFGAGVGLLALTAAVA